MRMYFQGLLAALAFLICTASAYAQNGDLSFVVISPVSKSTFDEGALRGAIEASDADNLAFVVVNGIKASAEPCSDNLYKHRKTILHGAKNGVIVSLTAGDWAACKNASGKSAAAAKLNILRELLFSDALSLGGSKIPVVRQSTIARFRGFPENARWEIGEMMFATLNLPANNNNYVSDAGRNSEFEDRLVANRDWLRRIFLNAARRKLDGIVVFCDGNPLLETRRNSGSRDGYLEIRRELTSAAAKYSGKVLLVHSQGPARSAEIQWQRNLGELSVGSGALRLTINQSGPELFSVSSFSD